MADDGGDFWSGVAVTAVLAGGLYYCTREEEPKKTYPLPVQTYAVAAAGGATTDAPPTPVAAPAPVHNYDEKDGATYYYVAAVSEDERKAGKSSGFVSSYQYGGKDDNGGHIVFGAGQRYTCSVPCKIIKASSGARFEYNKRSVISAVFQDAMRGFLQPLPTPKTQPIQDDSRTVTPRASYQDASESPDGSGGIPSDAPSSDGVPTEEGTESVQ